MAAAVSDLDRYLAASASLPWIWGVSDCTMWVADWCRNHFGHDPAAAFRGGYDDEAGARMLTMAGLLETIRPWMAPLRPTSAPLAGDVGILCLTARQVAGICTGPAWAIRTPRGLFEAPMTPLCAWSR